MPKERNLKRRLKQIGLVVACFVVFYSLQSVPSGYFVVHPGPVMDLANIVEIENCDASGASFYMVSVLAKDASVTELAGALFNPNLGLWPKKQVLGGRSAEEYMEANKALMKDSQMIATYVALNIQGISVPPNGPFPVQIRIKPGQVAGPSAGLVFALEILTRIDHDIVMGRKIAGTGVLGSNGKVRAVGGIVQKTIACRKEGIEIFLVPKQNLEEALPFAGSMKVYGVDTVEEAVWVLSQDGDS